MLALWWHDRAELLEEADLAHYRRDIFCLTSYNLDLEMTAWVPPESFGEYRLIRKLGDGAMGQVYLALDALLDRPVAVKFIASGELSVAQRERFLIEARAAARLQHPNVVAVHRVGELGGRPYLISEFVRGQSLDKLAKPLSSQRVLELAIGLARGLAAAHRKGVLHRDIKPANAVLTSDGEVKLIDFGLAKLFESPETRMAPVPLPNAQAREEKRRDHDATISVILPKNGHPRSSPEPDSLPVAPVGVPLGATPDMFAATDVSERTVQSKLSRTGHVMGTPYYLAPELWTGETATVRSDIYALGALLYELATGSPPHYHANDQRSVGFIDLAIRVTSSDARPLAEAAKDIDPRLAAIIDRCLRRMAEERFASTDELLDAFLESDPSAAPSPSIPEGNPYRGLHPFDAEHRALFFGRRSEVRAVIERLRQESFVLVTGDSGAGKSSLCRAGVLPHLLGELERPRTWSIVQMIPGRRPLLALTAALSPYLSSSEGSQPELKVILSLLQHRHRDGAGLVLFIDQLEELLSLSDALAGRDCAEVLGLLAGAPGVRLLATARIDFLTRLAGLPGLGDEIARAIYVLPPMSADNIKEAVVGPAQAMGFRFEREEDVDLLVKSAMASPGGLPLLQFALEELWHLRDVQRRVIAHKDLVAIGGVEGALARHADHVIRSLLPAERAAARRLLTRLITSERTRARQPHDELVGDDPHASKAIDALVRARLVVARAEETGTDYELAHEALIEGWGQLKGWLKNDADRRLAKERLGRSAAEWLRLGDDELLFSEKQLLELEQHDLRDLGSTERSFLARSRQKIRSKRVRRWALTLIVLLFASLLALGARESARLETERRVMTRLTAARAMLDRAKSKNGEVEGLRAASFARFDAGELSAGEKIWAAARTQARTVTASLAAARRELEASLAIDSTRSDVRELLVAAEMLRAEIAERDLASDVLDDALARLGEWDASGAAAAHWRAPAHLRIATHPAKARASIGRYREETHDRWPLENVRPLGETPTPELVLVPGSYLVTLEAEGFAPVRYPILLHRGEDQKLDIRLVEAKRVPEGFVHIPEGNLLFGSAADDVLRTSFDKAVPIHPTKTGPFLIARHETTYAEWIAFLDATGRKTSGGPWPAGLRRMASGKWELGIRQGEGGKARTLRSGETVAVGDAKHDWSHWPVDQVLAADAEAYFHWLDETGRVPKARYCTESEWERAARGADARLYPHGNKLDPEDADFSDTSPLQIRHEVGSHPASRSPFGLEDAVGNVWEMVDSLDRDPTRVVVRGGAFYSDRTYATVIKRDHDARGAAWFGVGVRVCADLP